ncbi:MAG: glycoside hydrolase family 3 N-terminal domain-containing protein [Desulfonatronovibrio sp.]
MQNIFLVIFLTITFILSGALFPNHGTTATLEEKIGQMIMVGFRGLEISSGNPVIEDIAELGIGGVILFDYDRRQGGFERNIHSSEQVKKLISSLKSLPGGDDLFVAINQEGGGASPLKERYGFSASVSNLYPGGTEDIGITRERALDTAEILSQLGFNLNLVPVVDVNPDPEHPVKETHKKSFSHDPDIVVSHAWEIINAHRIYKVLTAAKHFPGYGSAGNETYLNFPDTTRTWDDRELIPYRELMADPGCDMIMTGHIVNRRLDPEWPATLSEKIISGILRQKMDYDGVVISEDMQMDAIRKNYSLDVALERAITAGVDIILFANNLVYEPDIARKSVKTIKNLIDQGRLTEDRINESYQRIMDLKARLKPLVESDCSFCLK